MVTYVIDMSSLLVFLFVKKSTIKLNDVKFESLNLVPNIYNVMAGHMSLINRLICL